MATSFVVIATDLRRATVKFPDGGYMFDVLEEACSKLKLDAETYQLKHANRSINLADRISMLRLPQGAKLELVLKSKTPTAVTVALRLPPSEARLKLPGDRVVAKVRNDTSLWKLLRYLEEVDDAKQRGLNLTARGVPRTSHTGTATAAASAVGSGSGQIYWEMPVLKFAGRELSSFRDFQKTLSQVGIDTGSHQISLDFRVSELTLQEAMETMQTQLDATDNAAASNTSAPPANTEQAAPAPESAPYITPSQAAAPDAASSPTNCTEVAPAHTTATPTAASLTLEPSSDLQPVQVWLPPKTGAGMPAAASLRWSNESESAFAPSVMQMKAHQKQLEEAGRNKRLKSDKEIEEEKSEREAKAAAVSRVGVRIRFPDGYTAMWSFANGATGSTLYAAVRNVLAPGVQDQPFRLVPPMSRDAIQDSGDRNKHDLVRHYGMRGGMMVNFLRGADVPAPAAGQAYVKPAVAALAQDIVIPQSNAEDDEDDDAKERATAASRAAYDAKKTNKAEAVNKMSKFLRLAKK